MRDTDAMLFDLDGVLVDSRIPFTLCVNHALAEHGFPHRADTELQRYIGPPLHQTFWRLVGDDGGGAVVESCVEAYREHYRAIAADRTPVMAGMRTTVERLAQALPLVVATSKPRALAEPLLRALKLRSHFRAVVGPDLTAANEHKGETVRRALRKVAGSRSAVMVGDRKYDVQAAQQHGLRSIGVLWGIGTADELTSAGADALAHTPSDLLGLVLGR